MEIQKIVDAKNAKRIIAVVKGHGRVVLFEGDDYPKDGIAALDVAKIDAAIAKVLDAKDKAMNDAKAAKVEE